MIVTATRQAGIKYVALNNYKNKIAGYLVDKTESYSLVGKSSYQSPEIAGRVLVKHESAVNLMQVYTMVSFKNEIQYNEGITALIEKLCQMHPTMRAPRIPVLPEKFVSTMLGQYMGSIAQGIGLGLQKETVELRLLERDAAAPFLILGDSGKGKTNLLKVILQQIAGKEKIYLFDTSNKELFYHKEDEKLVYVETKDEAEEFLEEFKEEVLERKSCYYKALEKNPRLSPKEFYLSMDALYIVIDDTDEFVEKFAALGKGMVECLKLAVETGCSIIATTHTTKTKGFDEISKFFKVATEGILLGNPGSLSIFPTVSSKQLPSLGEGLLYHNGTYERLLLPQYEELVKRG